VVAPAPVEPAPSVEADPIVEERISDDDVTEVAQGDGFDEQRQETAGIDEVLPVTAFEVPGAIPETPQAVAADLETVVHDIDIPLNPRVLAFVQLFTGRLKAFLEEGLGRGLQYLPMIQGIFRAEGLPVDLAYVPLVESAFKPTALSRAKAKGIWQFMRGTALENGLKHDWYIDERAEPEKATRAAAKYLKTLRDMFDGDWHLALASYNGGPARVQRAMKQSGRSDFWKLAASGRYLPRETRDYVPLILAAIVIARNPAVYGFESPFVEPMQYETVPLSTPIDLRRIAEWAGTPVQTIQELNPELRRWTTPVGMTEYGLKVPAGTGAIVQERLAEADPTALAPLDWHTVKKGETLLSIAKALKVSRTDLAEANYLSPRAKVSPGQRLVVPRAPALVLAARPEVPPPAGDPPALEPPAAATVNPAAGKPRPEPQPVQIAYRVKRGDTLSSIARLYSTTVASLKRWNRLRSNSIQVGQRLTIFTTRGAMATN
jgi:membrane-bound lytic murein transglycosylase D